MDNISDFQFLEESFAVPFNKEYLVIISSSRSWRLHIIESFDCMKKAVSCAEFNNLGSDNYTYDVVIRQHGKLWNKEGGLSQKQDWQVDKDYLIVSRDHNVDGEIETCSCSYPLFYGLSACMTSDNEAVEYWGYITCLEDDNGRRIYACPNCNKSLLPDDEDEDNSPTVCRGCKHYHSEIYNGNKLICAMHPSRYEESICPDWES